MTFKRSGNNADEAASYEAQAEWALQLFTGTVSPVAMAPRLPLWVGVDSNDRLVLAEHLAGHQQHGPVSWKHRFTGWVEVASGPPTSPPS